MRSRPSDELSSRRVPVTVNYTLTDLGHRLSDAVTVLREWAYDNIEDIEIARAAFDTAAAAQPSASEAV